jgi:hypothetical protein
MSGLVRLGGDDPGEGVVATAVAAWTPSGTCVPGMWGLLDLGEVLVLRGALLPASSGLGEASDMAGAGASLNPKATAVTVRVVYAAGDSATLGVLSVSPRRGCGGTWGEPYHPLLATLLAKPLNGGAL